MPAVKLHQASLTRGGRKLWQKLDLSVEPGEFVAVLGPNGSGKTSLIRVLLGLEPLTSGAVEVMGEPPRRGTSAIGYVPQQKAFDTDLPIRGRDLVRFGIDGHRVGVGFGMEARRRVEKTLAEVGALAYADAPIGRLSGGEQQRLRIAQALVGDPRVLLCDEPLLSLDLSQQQVVTELIDQRRQKDTAVLFITHDINPILSVTDRILYLVGERWAVGTPSEVLTSETLSQVYGATVDVIRVRGRVVVVGAGEPLLTEPDHHHGHHAHLEER